MPVISIWCDVNDGATFDVLATLVICDRGICTGATWGGTYLAGRGTAVSILSCVVHAKLNVVTGFSCAETALELG